MSRTTFVDYSTVLTASYMNDVNRMTYGTDNISYTTWLFQPGDTNRTPVISVRPNGSGTNSTMFFYNGSNNADSGYLYVDPTVFRIGSSGNSILPIVFSIPDGNGGDVYSLKIQNNSISIPKTAGFGIKVDPAAPTYAWRDITATVQPKTTGVGSPTRAVYAGANLNQYSFVANDVCEFEFHIPHDYVPGTDIYFHVHWSHTGSTISGSAVFNAYYTYASGHNTMNFPAEKTLTITVSTPDVATVPQYRHRVDEVIMTGPSATATLTDRDTIEVDGVVLLTLKLSTLPTLGGGGKLFIHTADLHYQSSNMGTKQRAPDFYV